MNVKNNARLYLFGSISILTIISTIVYVCKFAEEKQLVLTERDQLFVYLFSITIIVLLAIGVIIGYMLSKIYKQNRNLLLINTNLETKLGSLESLLNNLFGKIEENLDNTEDNLVNVIREAEDDIVRIINKK